MRKKYWAVRLCQNFHRRSTRIQVPSNYQTSLICSEGRVCNEGLTTRQLSQLSDVFQDWVWHNGSLIHHNTANCNFENQNLNESYFPENQFTKHAWVEGAHFLELTLTANAHSASPGCKCVWWGAGGMLGFMIEFLWRKKLTIKRQTGSGVECQRHTLRKIMIAQRGGISLLTSGKHLPLKWLPVLCAHSRELCNKVQFWVHKPKQHVFVALLHAAKAGCTGIVVSRFAGELRSCLLWL